MTMMHWLIGVALAAVQVAGPPESPPPSAPESAPSATTTVVPLNGFDLGAKPANEVTKTQAQTILSQCSDRRFETSAEGMIDGEMRRRKITLCAAPGDSDAQWIVKLENAVVWVKAQAGLSDPVKAKLVGDLTTKIGQLRSFAPLRALPSAGLPAMDALVATVPPMPPPLPRPTLSASSLLAGALPLPVRPPLTIRCLDTGERGAGTRCDRLAPDTVFTVHADADLAGPATLRFVRKGQLRAEIAVAALRQGQIFRLKLPPQVCSGVVRSDVSIEIMAESRPGQIAQVADKLGPFGLHC
jgi:hypothetical protein